MVKQLSSHGSVLLTKKFDKLDNYKQLILLSLFETAYYCICTIGNYIIWKLSQATECREISSNRHLNHFKASHKRMEREVNKTFIQQHKKVYP